MADKILVIEDDEGIAGTLYRGLTFEGYKVNVAYDGPNGLASVRDDPPDLVVLDWMLPGLDGLEVCKRIRAAGSTPILDADRERCDRRSGAGPGRRRGRLRGQAVLVRRIDGARAGAAAARQADARRSRREF